MSKFYYGLGISGVVLLLFVLPIEMPFTVNTHCKILPVKQYYIVNLMNEGISTRLVNNKTGLIEESLEIQNERGSLSRLQLNSSLSNAEHINKDEVVFTVTSSMLNERIVELKNRLNEQIAQLNLITSGMKNEVIDMLKNRIVYSEKEVEEANKLYLRRKALYEGDLISEEDYELAKGQKELSEIEVATNRNELSIAASGAKEEEINYCKTQITSLRNQIEVLEKRKNNYVIRSPFNGIVSSFTSGDTLLAINDPSEFIAYVPVNAENETTDLKVRRVEFISPITEQVYTGKLFCEKTILDSWSQQSVDIMVFQFEEEYDLAYDNTLLECAVIYEDLSLPSFLYNILFSRIN